MKEQGRPRHGSPIFYALLEKMANTHDKKSHDYASNDNPSGNYHFAGRLALLFSHSEQDAGFVGRIGEKLYRLANLESSKKNPSNESIEDTEIDICVITTLWMADRQARRNKLAQETIPQNWEDSGSASNGPHQEGLEIQFIHMAEEMTATTLHHCRQYLNSIIELRNRKSAGPSQT